MLDGLKKNPHRFRPVKFKELEEKGLVRPAKPPRRVKGGKKPHLSFESREERVKITSPVRLRRKLVLSIGTPFVLVLIALGALSQTYFFQLTRLASSLHQQTLLVGFQNSAELRPTGGFWGSFALWNIKKNLGESELIFETNPYKADNELLKESAEELPAPMKETWPTRPQSFVNANWALDFPEAAKTLEWYFGQGWGEKTDAVVGVSSLAMIDLLKITGPITTSDGTQISADNFTETMSQKIDTEYWQMGENAVENEPKTILKELAPQIIAKVKKAPKLQLYRFFIAQLKQGRILLFFNNPRQNKIAEKIATTGQLAPTKVDFLMLNNANLNGGKTSLNVDQKINYEVKETEGSIAHLEITRTHRNLWPGILNRNYTRVAVPLGSKLVSATLDGEDIAQSVQTSDESGKTTFGFWFSVSPGEEKTAILEYELPFQLQNQHTYDLIVQKQPGTNPDELKVTVFGKTLFQGVNNLSTLNL